MIDGEVIAYWMGAREPAGGYAIGIALEVDALSLFFGLLIATAVLSPAATRSPICVSMRT